MAPIQQKDKLATRLLAKLTKLGGVSERTANTLVKVLVPFVRSLITSEVKKALADQGQPTDPAAGPTVASQAIRINGVSLRVDLPVVPSKGATGLELLRVMDGVSSHRSYLVAAVKGTDGIVAVRQFSDSKYRVKFYPNMAHWGVEVDELIDLYGARDFVGRDTYERMMFNNEGLQALLAALEKQATPKGSKTRRLLALAYRPLTKAFTYLHQPNVH